ncbi:FAM40 family protein [Heterostelium album PN500]|uniref:FAM40 family protein n=1 Tax=Heterostelium pallidum (strain ATCC 26659 / Pp 5 / PN500) TaxID=670386 RepID=D3BSY9_HETP5|nr:FAM40 family protein [Heterostelium album PN500]EFA75604.1 FAM40 family protein [Heterostelium album PN500]|eukprot:XP_020427738.1 FAM40 family protein [Heterostelium album PN500]
MDVVTQSNDGGDNNESNTLSFIFSDNDNFQQEINELYSYAELSLLRKLDLSTLFINDLEKYRGDNKQWIDLNEQDRLDYIDHTLQYLECSPSSSSEHYQRYLSKAHILLYIAQGCTSTIAHQPDQQKQHNQTVSSLSIANSKLLRSINAISILLKSLLFSSNLSNSSRHVSDEHQQQQQQQQQQHHHVRGNKTPPKINTKRADHLMSVLLNIIYHILVANQDDPTFREEMQHFEDDNEIIATMLELTSQFNEIEGNRYPIKKILLVLWKSMIVLFGGFNQLIEMKDKRLQSINYSKETPKTSPYDVYSFIKGTSRFHYHLRNAQTYRVTSHLVHTNGASSTSPNPMVNNTNKKYDMFKLPNALGESLRVLEKNLYPPPPLYKEIGVIIPDNNSNNNNNNNEQQQQQQEQQEFLPRLLKYNSNSKETMSMFERFYSSNINGMSKIIIVFLKILLAAVPGVKSYTGPINLMSEIIIDSSSPGHSASLVETMQSAVDFLRHKEIISKSLLAILLLILKHAKYNQILQFEYITQIIYESNGLVLLYKHLSHESIDKYIMSQNNVLSEEFYPIIQDTQNNNISNNNNNNNNECWRNIFSTICVLRIIQKISKYNPSRFTVITPTKAVNILKKYSVIEQKSIKMYSLKIIKNLIPYLARKWRQNNMKVITDIFLEVPIHINDIWLSSQSELTLQQSTEMEVSISDRIEEYHQKNYEQWYDFRNGGTLKYSVDNQLGMNEIDFLYNSIELNTDEKEHAAGLAEIYSDQSSVISVTDKLEDMLLSEKWNLQQPSFSLRDPFKDD